MKAIPIFNTLLTLLFALSACILPAPAAPVSSVEPAAAPINESTVAAGATRTITDAAGHTVVIPLDPQRIVALEWTYVEALLALGIQPVGVADIAGYKNWVQIPVELAEDVVDVGTRQAPNLETLAGLNPDLILAPSFRVAEIYDQLSAIAPTLAFDPYPIHGSITHYEEMRQTFLTIAEVTNRRAAGEAVLAQMERTFASARNQIEVAGRLGEPFILAQAFGGDTVQVRLFTGNALAVEIVEQIGLKNVWEDETFQQYGFTTVSVETLPELGDVNFFYVVQEENNVFAREAIAPVWESLAFVRSNHAYPLGGDTWLFGGPLSAERLVAIIQEALLLEVTPAPATRLEGARTVTHALGATEVPSYPQRVVVLDNGTLDNRATFTKLTMNICWRWGSSRSVCGTGMATATKPSSGRGLRRHSAMPSLRLSAISGQSTSSAWPRWTPT